MGSSAHRLWLAAALLLLARPAGAQEPVFGAGVRREPARASEQLFAARVTRAARLRLQGTSHLVQAATRARPLAGQLLEGRGERVDLTELAVRRLRFATPAAAKAAAGLLGRGARVDPRAPRCVTQVTGRGAGPELLAKAEAGARGAKLAADLAKALGRAETARAPDACRLRVPSPAIGLRGVEVRLEGLTVLRLRFAGAGDATRFVEREVKSAKPGQVLDQVGGEVVLLLGSATSRAPKVLRAAWKADPPGRDARKLLGVWSGREAFAVLCVGNGALYQRAAGLLRRCRKAERGLLPGGVEWRFTDPEARNDLRLRPKLVRPGTPARYGGVLATQGGLIHVRSATRAAPERSRLLRLMAAVGVKTPESAERVELLAPE